MPIKRVGTKLRGYYVAYEGSPHKYHYHTEQTERHAHQQALNQLRAIEISKIKESTAPKKVVKKK